MFVIISTKDLTVFIGGSENPGEKYGEFYQQTRKALS
jgi:hypothetical protein